MGTLSFVLLGAATTIAVEVHAAPVRDLAVKNQAANVSWRGPPTPWPHAGVVAARLTAEPAPGLVPSKRSRRERGQARSREAEREVRGVTLVCDPNSNQLYHSTNSTS